MTVLTTVLGFVGVLFIFAIALQVAFPKAHPELMTMTPAEEARYEMHPTLTPGTMVLTNENVHDVVNDTIESGVTHPALLAQRPIGSTSW